MLRKSSRLFFKRFRGLNSNVPMENAAPDEWIDSMNVLVNANGSAEVLRSPKSVNESLETGNPVLSMADYLSPSTHKLLFDIQTNESESSGDLGSISTYTINDDLTNNLIRTGQYGPFVSAVVNNKLFRLNPEEFIQCQEDIETFYRVGIDPPAAAPTIAYAEDSDSMSGSADDDIADGIQFSYAYHNTVTGHVSRPCPISNRLDAGGPAIEFAVVASTQDGVDKLVFFATLDGGSIPYLLIDEEGDLNTRPNTTGTVNFDISELHWDTLTPEPIFNYVPPLGARFLFVWKDRVIALDFIAGSDVARACLAYSGFESTYIGQPGESWPTLNQIGIPNKGEVLRGGIGTQVGALILSDLDAYLLSGYPTDKTSGPEAAATVTEHLEPLHWNIGTQSAKTIRNTPFGTIWLDHAQRLRVWRGEGFPTEIGLPLKNELAQLDPTRLNECEGQWFQMGKNGGYYALIGPLAGGLGQRLFIVTLYEDPESRAIQVGYGISSISGYCLQPVRVFSTIRMFMGGLDQCFTILDPDVEGDGWPDGSLFFFDLVLGNDENFTYWHSLRFDGDTEGLTLTVRNPDQSIINGRTLTVTEEDEGGGSSFAVIDEYGRRKILRFAFTEGA